MTYEQLEQKLHELAPRLAPTRRAVAEARQMASAAQSAVQQARAEYNYYAGMSADGMTDEQQQKLQMVASKLAEQVSEAESMQRSAEERLTRARAELDALESSLRQLAGGYETVKSRLYAEMGKLRETIDKLAGLRNNRYGSSLEGAEQTATAVFNDRHNKYNNCNIRIRQISQALNGSNDDDDDRDPPQKVLTKGRGR